MADAGILREFLVSLGWSVDRTGQRQFEEAVAGAQKAAFALAGALTGIVASVAKVAQSYEQLYYASQRAQSSATGMQSFAYAVSQVGGNAQAARASLQSMGNFLRSTPGGESFIQHIGVQTRNANGELRDTADVMQDLAKQFRSEPYYRARAQAGVLGIDENTLQAMERGLGQFSDEYRDVYRRAGISQEQAAKSSATFMQQLRSLGLVFQVLRDKVAISLERGVGGDIVRFRALILDNFDRISVTIEAASRFVLGLGAALMQLFGRGAEILAGLWDRFDHLDRSTKGWIETIGALGVAWYLLNRGFLATPIGRLLALGTAILALYDDYRVWKAGGTSLIDWAQWEPGINAALDAMHQMGALFDDLWPRAERWLTPLTHFLRTEFIAAFSEAGKTVGSLAQAVGDLSHGRWRSAWEHVRDIGRQIGADNQGDATALGRMVGDYGDLAGIPRGIRNNNPGNLNFVGQAGARLETMSSHPRFAQFATPAAGLAAMAGQLRTYMTRDHIDTIQGIISKWAPGTDGNDTASYVAGVARSMHIGATAALDPNNAGQLSGLMHAITQRENGYDPFAQDNYRYALASIPQHGGSNGQPLTVTQTNTINVSGAQHPEQTGQSVLRVQNQASANLVRNAKSRLG